MNKYTVPPKIEKHLRRNKRFCSICKEAKSLTEDFYFHKKRKSYIASCKSCQVARVMKYHKTTKGYKLHLEAGRKYALTPKGKESNRKYSQSNKGKLRRGLYNKSYRQTLEGKKALARGKIKHFKIYPEKRLARLKVFYAVKSGKMKKTPCEVCGESKVHGHHQWGYTGENALKVMWLCENHHFQIHHAKVV